MVMDKRGQFYFVAAIIIVMIISGLASVSTYVIIKSEPDTIRDITRDLNRESYKIVEYGVYNAKDIDDLLTGFTGEQVGEYFLQKTSDANIIYLYGNKDGMKALQYDSGSQGSISIGAASFNSVGNFVKIKEISAGEMVGKSVINVELLGRDYNFEVKDGEMFYFVIVQESDGEIFLGRSEDSNSIRPGV